MNRTDHRFRRAQEHDRRVAVAFGATLRSARERRGLSTDELADRGGFDRVYPCILEQGIREPTLGDLLRASVAAGIAPTRLLEETVLACTQWRIGRTDVMRLREIWLAFVATLSRHHGSDPVLATVMGSQLLDELALHGLAIVNLPFESREGCGRA